MSSDLDRLARWTKLRTDEEKDRRSRTDFAGRKANMERSKRDRQEKKRLKKAG